MDKMKPPMKRPDVPAMEQLERLRRKIEETEAVLDQLRQKLKQIPFEIARQVRNDARTETARYLYWMVQDIPSASIAEAFFNTTVYNLRRLVGIAEGDIPCDRCKQPAPFRSRTHLKESIDAIRKWKASREARYAEGYVILCDTCWDEVKIEREEDDKQYQNTIKMRLLELKSMSYVDYLQSPEWQDRKEDHLEITGNQCQVCNCADQSIDVHHKTNDRRGEEYFEDLLALCDSCRNLLHSQGKLAGQLLKH